MAPSPLAEVICNAETAALLLPLSKSIYYLIFLMEGIMDSFLNLFYLFVMLLLQLINTAQIIKDELRHI